MQRDGVLRLWKQVSEYLLKVVTRDHTQQMFDEIADIIEKIWQPQILRNTAQESTEEHSRW